MALKITNSETDGVAVLGLDGRIVLGEETNKLRESVKNLIAQGKKNVILDMQNVTMMTALVSAH